MTDITAPRHLLIFGQGYSASAVAERARQSGWRVTGTRRTQPNSPDIIPIEAVGPLLQDVTHILLSIPPGQKGDPAWRLYAETLRHAPRLAWIGYYSTTGVYGDRQGARVDESTPPAPGQARSQARVEAERAWASLAAERAMACDIMRLGGIYGPGRSAFDTLRSGHARAIDAPEHCFSRIHRDDIAEGTLAAIETAAQTPIKETRILNFTDNEPSPQRDVLEEAARLLHLPPPPVVTLAQAWPQMSPMAQGFWSERRVVDSTHTQKTLQRPWRYPSYREGLAAILAAAPLP